MQFEGLNDRTWDRWDVECERKQGVKDDSQVYEQMGGNEDAIYGDTKDFKMIVDEDVHVEQNNSSILGLC